MFTWLCELQFTAKDVKDVLRNLARYSKSSISHQRYLAFPYHSKICQFMYVNLFVYVDGFFIMFHLSCILCYLQQTFVCRTKAHITPSSLWLWQSLLWQDQNEMCLHTWLRSLNEYSFTEHTSYCFMQTIPALQLQMQISWLVSEQSWLRWHNVKDC